MNTNSVAQPFQAEAKPTQNGLLTTPSAKIRSSTSLKKLQETMLEYRYKPSSISSNLRVLKAFENKMSTTPLAELSPSEALKLAHQYFTQNRLTQSYWASILNALKLYFRFVRNTELEASNLPFNKFDEKLPEHLSEEEVQSGIRAVSKIKSQEKRLQSQAILLMLYGMGIRTGEIRLLKRNQIESALQMKSLRILHTNNKDFRHVPFPEVVQNAISEYLLVCNPRQYLFEGAKEGRPMSERGIQSCVAKVGKLAELKRKISPNTLRNSFATHLLQKGASLEYVSHLMGHKNLATTRRFLSIAPVFKPRLSLEEMVR